MQQQVQLQDCKIHFFQILHIIYICCTEINCVYSKIMSTILCILCLVWPIVQTYKYSLSLSLPVCGCTISSLPLPPSLSPSLCLFYTHTHTHTHTLDRRSQTKMNENVNLFANKIWQKRTRIIWDGFHWLMQKHFFMYVTEGRLRW